MATHRFPVIADHNFSLGGKATLTMISGNGVMKEFFKFQGIYIYLIEHIFHIVEVYIVLRILEVPHECSDPGRHFGWANRTDFSPGIDHIMSNKQLLGFLVNHTGCRGSSHTFSMDGHGHILVYRIELMIGPSWLMGSIGDHP